MHKPITLLPLAGLLFAGSAVGQTLLNQPPHQKFSLKDSVGVQSVADDMIVAKPAGVVVTALDVYGGWTPNGTAVADTFNVIFHESALQTTFPFEQIPSTVVASFSNLGAAPLPTGKSFPTFAGFINEYRLTIPLPTPVVLGPGQYWIEVYSTASSGTGEEFQWGMADTDPVNGGACVSYSNTTPGNSWSSCTPLPAKAMAMTVYGGANGPSLYVNNLISGSSCTFSVEDAGPAAPIFMALSGTGAGPVGTPWGNILLSPPWEYLPLLGADIFGNGTLNVPVPAGFSGVPIWFQGLDLSTLTLTNGIATTIQ